MASTTLGGVPLIDPTQLGKAATADTAFGALDSMLNGTLTIAVGSNPSPYTIPYTAGDEPAVVKTALRFNILEFTGALSASYTAYMPSGPQRGLFVVTNSTTGSHAVTLMCPGQTGVTIPAGETFLCCLTGTDVVQISPQAAGGGGGGGGSGLYSQVLSTLPTITSTGFSTWVNQGSATLANGSTGLVLTAPSSGSTNILGVTKAAPSTPYTVTALIAMAADSANYPQTGIGWYDGSSKIEFIMRQAQNGSEPHITVSDYSSPTAFAGNLGSGNVNSPSTPTWFQIEDDGTDVHYRYSQDGASFYEWYSVAKSSGYLGSSGYSNIFFGLSNQGGPVISTLMSYTD